MKKWGVIGLLLGLGLNAAVQVSAYRSFQATFHQGDGTQAGFMAGLWMQFSWIKLACSGLLGMVLGELYQQKADQRALVREIEADRRAKGGSLAPEPAAGRRSLVQRIFDKFNF